MPLHRQCAYRFTGYQAHDLAVALISQPAGWVLVFRSVIQYEAQSGALGML